MQPLRLAAGAAAAAILLVASGCGGSGSSSTPASTAAPASTPESVTPSGSSGGNSTAQSGGSTDIAAFCSMLVDGADKSGALMAAVGTPDQTPKLAEVTASNEAIVAAAPAEVRDAIVKFYAISELGRKALDPNLSAAEKRAAGAEAAAAVTAPDAKAAIATYKDWVQTNCPSQSAKILSGV